jgi:hypothetical protein
MAQTKLSTGILVRNPASFNAHVDIGNLNQSAKRNVSVEILDWGVDQLWDTPKPVPVSPSGTVTIGPHTLRSFIALITQSTAQPGLNLAHYEVRVTVSNITNVVVNCFAIDSSGNIITGNTVLHNNLVEIT